MRSFRVGDAGDVEDLLGPHAQGDGRRVVLRVGRRRHGDDRGWFSEVYKRHTLRDAGIDIEFVQDNESFSAPVGEVASRSSGAGIP